MVKFYFDENGRPTIDECKARNVELIEKFTPPEVIIPKDDPYWDRGLNDTTFEGLYDFTCPICGNQWSRADYSCNSNFIGNPCHCSDEFGVAELYRWKGKAFASEIMRCFSDFIKTAYLLNINPLPRLRLMFGKKFPIEVVFFDGYDDDTIPDVSVRSLIDGRARVLFDEYGSFFFERTH